jgi:hypothetical protein
MAPGLVDESGWCRVGDDLHADIAWYTRAVMQLYLRLW